MIPLIASHNLLIVFVSTANLTSLNYLRIMFNITNNNHLQILCYGLEMTYNNINESSTPYFQLCTSLYTSSLIIKNNYTMFNR